MDRAHVETENKLTQLEKILKKEYYKAYEEVSETANDYFMQFAKQDEKRRLLVESGEMPQEQYIAWRNEEMLIDEKWQELERRIAIEYQNTNKVAYALTRNMMIDVYALNRNYIYSRLTKDTGIDISFSLYDRKSVERLLTKRPNLLPKPSDEALKNMGGEKVSRYHRKKIRSIATRSIIKGDSIPDIAKNICKETGQADLNNAVRQARTMMTSAQNGGRLDSLIEAKERYKKYGIIVKKKWIATDDNRTRHSHRYGEGVGGEIVDVDDVFSNGLKCPGDTSGNPSEIYNCRCTMRSVVEYEK